MSAMEITKEIKQRLIASDNAFMSFEHHVFEWGTKQKRLMREAKTILSQDQAKHFPENYLSYTRLNYLESKILTDEKMLNRVKATQEPFMVSREKQILAKLIERPAFWCYFTVQEIHGDDFVTIKDLFSGKTHLMHSPALCDKVQKIDTRCKYFLSLMRHDGDALGHVAILRAYSLSKADFLFYCSLFADSEPDEELSLETIINAHYADFFTLDNLMQVAPTMRGEHELKTTWQPFTLGEFDITCLEGTWNTVPLGSQTRYDLVTLGKGLDDLPYRRLFDISPPLMAGMLVRDNDSGEMGFMTNSEPCHALFAALLKRAYPLLELLQIPIVSIPAKLFLLIIKVPVTLPWEKFKKTLSYAG